MAMMINNQTSDHQDLGHRDLGHQFSQSQYLQELMDKVENMLDHLLTKMAKQDESISKLHTENIALKKQYQAVNQKIAQYIVELEQIKKYYVNSNNLD